MNLAIVSLNDSTDVHHWSGLNYYISRSLERAGATVHRVGPLRSRWTPMMKLRQRWHDALGSTYHAIMEPAALAAIGTEARARIPSDADAVLAVTSLVAAAIGPLRIPLVSWDDATYAGMRGYYPDFQHMARVSRGQSERIGRRAVESVALAIYASEWAAESACNAYGVSRRRVAVVPFGANLERPPDAASVERSITARPTDICRLLWVGVEWTRKGGPLAVAIAQAIVEAGIPVELTIVGCEPPDRERLPAWVRLEGFISKREPSGEARLAELFARAHFFVMPSSAEAYGLVYAEAASFGVPCVAIRTGGVPTIVLDDVTGLLEEASSGAQRFGDRVIDLFRHRARYDAMARAARSRADALLNWDVAGATALDLITACVRER